MAFSKPSSLNKGIKNITDKPSVNPVKIIRKIVNNNL